MMIPGTGDGRGASASERGADDSCRETHNALEDGDRRFRDMFERSPVMYQSLYPDRRIRDVNPAWLAMSGYERGEVLGKPFETFLAPDSAATFPARFAHLLEKGASSATELTFLRKDGRIIVISVDGVVVKTEDGRPSHTHCVAHDVTEHKLMTDRLAAIAREWQATFDAVGDAIWILDPHHRVLRANAATRAHFGIDAEVCTGRFCWEVVHGTTAPPPECPIPRVRAHLRRQSVELAIGDRWLQVVADPLLDEDGGYAGAVHIVTDITRRKQRELELRESRQHLLEAQRISRVGSWVWYAGTRRVFCSREMCRMWGYPTDTVSLKRRQVMERIHPEDRGLVRDAISRAVASAQRVDITFRTLLRDGTERTIQAVVYAERDQQGQLTLVRGVGQDITEQKHAEAERENLQAQLLHARKMESVGRLAGGIAHDFNNMLAVIIGHADLLLVDTPLDDPRREDLEEILRAANRSADLTRQLLGFARKQLIAPKVLDPNRTIEGMLQMLRRLIGEHIDLVWQPAQDLWPVLMDPGQVDQVLVNLCVNARDAIADSGTVLIETLNAVLDEAYCRSHAGFVPGDYAVLAVTDDGCGIIEGHLDRVFEPFFTTKEVGQGTGMGLATVYGIVKQNNGFVNVYSEPGEGTTFKVYLPRHHGETEAAPSTCGKRPRGNGETVLLVEDEPGVLAMISAMLRQLGYTVIAADRPDEALERAAENAGDIHLLLTDVVLPQMSGKELARRVAEHCPDIRVLYASGYTANAIANKGVLDASCHFIQKPFNTNELALMVREALEAAPHRDEAEPVPAAGPGACPHPRTPRSA